MSALPAKRAKKSKCRALEKRAAGHIKEKLCLLKQAQPNLLWDPKNLSFREIVQDAEEHYSNRSNTLRAVHGFWNHLQENKALWNDQNHIDELTYVGDDAFNYKLNVAAAMKKMREEKEKEKNEVFTLETKEDDNESNDRTAVEFGYHPHALHGVNKAKNKVERGKKELGGKAAAGGNCYHCNGRIKRQQGTVCMMKHCINPNVQRRATQRVQWHEHCVAVVDSTALHVCGCCLWVLSETQHCFASGNQFVKTDRGICKVKPIWQGKINDDFLVLFSGLKKGDAKTEFYFMQRREEVMCSRWTDVYTAWNNKFSDVHSRDAWERKMTTVKVVVDDTETLEVHLQYLRNSFNGYVSSWVALDGLEPSEELVSALINLQCQHVVESDGTIQFKANKRNQNKKGLDTYENEDYKAHFVGFTYKLLADKRFKFVLDYNEGTRDLNFSDCEETKEDDGDSTTVPRYVARTANSQEAHLNITGHVENRPGDVRSDVRNYRRWSSRLQNKERRCETINMETECTLNAY